MKYKYGERRRASEYEKALVDFWKKHNTFEKSIEMRSADKTYVFYDGPPFITGNPHHGTLLSSVVKDAVPRFWTMNGFRVERRWGWDCHGLPAENFVEKQLSITDRREIGTKISLEEYITKARESMVANSETWEQVIDRIGRWVDFKGAYKTMDKDFMESVWWAFKTLYDKGKIYEGKKVLMYDTKFATPVSKNEVTMDNDAYQTVTDPSVFVKFKVRHSELDSESSHKKYLLAWTTTPWTLPGNMALAVNPKLQYVEVEVNRHSELDSESSKKLDSRVKPENDKLRLILAKDLVEKVLVDDKKQPLDYKIVREMSGEDLVGIEYVPIFPEVDGSVVSGNAHKVWAAEFVENEGGTGIVHIAPAYGEDDYALALKHNIPVVDVLDAEGFYLPEMQKELEKLGVKPTHADKIEVWEGNKFIAKCLQEAGVVWKIDYIRHEYPFNPRSKQRIMYRAIPSWFFDIQDSKALMLEKNEDINWFPEYLKHGRFAKNIEQAPDWNLSRDRFWATPMPVWKGDKGTIKVLGSYEELEKLSGKTLQDYHRPWVDEVTFEINGEKFTRIEKVLDCWFESGSMPFAQLHYPFENKENFEKNYPADFIVEYIGQVRAWFYYVHVVNTALFDDRAYKNVITTGTLAGNDGRKMSKSLGNYTDPNDLMDKFSADALRFLMLSSPVLSGEDFALLDKDVSDVARKLTMVWNVYDFFTMYAEVDGWEFNGDLKPPKNLKNPLDTWIISRIYQLRDEITKNMNQYNLPDALAGVLPFIDDLSNWFVRRSRRRFWKSDKGADKVEAYETLHYALSYLALLLAPFVPFLAEELWQNMIGENSVHLEDWPAAGTIDEESLNNMATCRRIITDGLALRMNTQDEYGQIKVRQPLSELKYNGDKLDNFYEQIIAEEVNVKKITHHAGEIELNKTLTPELRDEGFARELIRFIQSARKKAGLNVDDRINLSISQPIPEAFKPTIQQETLATTLKIGENYSYDEIIKIDSKLLTISLEKA
ncbi:MAG: isoleucine--tRNA ligase [Candidatus Nomurabacteria bacterium]|jgi:isoleucyl-tRNA synthetase|nr:isoleucine--tRNA ligase [Candidatus Nomurabacteria bacterium]